MVVDDAASTPRSDGFRALRHVGFRIYFGGMLARGLVVWIQLVTVPWFAIELGAGPLEVGLVAGFQFLPALILAPLAGVLADRRDRGRLLMLTQVGSVIQSVGLLAIAATGVATVPMLMLFALTFGTLTALELPVRQSYLTELVSRSDLQSAVSLHATAWNTSRFAGPAIAGLVIAGPGIPVNFALTAAGALVVLGSVVLGDRYRDRSRQARITSGVRASLAEGARFAFGEPRIRGPLLLLAAGGILGIQWFQTLAPLYVAGPLGLHGGEFGLFMALWGGGALLSAYVITGVAGGDRRRWTLGGTAGLAILLVVLGSTKLVPLAFLVAAGLGVAQIALVQNTMISVQAAVPDELRGRIMGLYTTIFQGTAPFGSFIAGWLAEVAGVSTALLVGGGLLGGVASIGFIAAFRPSWMPVQWTGRTGGDK